MNGGPSRRSEDNFMHNQAFVMVGAATVVFRLKLKPGERLTYSFTDYGTNTLVQSILL
jgi:hypothetical protein